MPGSTVALAADDPKSGMMGAGTGQTGPMYSGPGTRHPAFLEMLPVWEACRHAYEGEATMRQNAARYIPRVHGDTDEDYKGYVLRAMWYGATARTVQGLTGSVFRVLPTYQSNDRIDDDMADVTMLGDPLALFAQEVFRELLITGRCPVMIDMADSPEAKRPYWVLFRSEQLISWEGDHEGGLTRAIFLSEEIEHDPEDEFAWVTKTRATVHDLDEASHYRVRKYQYVGHRGDGQEPWDLEETKTPQILGRPLDWIPIVIFGAGGIDPTRLYKPPICDVASINISHWRTSADYEHGAHVTSLPTPWVSGVQEDTDQSKKLRLGAREAWLLPDKECQAGMLEYTGQGLSTLENLSDSKKRDMALMGAKLLAEDKTGVETADAMRLRATGESSVLSALATAFDLGMSRCLDYHQRWHGLTEGGTAFETNRDFIDAKLSPQEAAAVMALWQAEAISYETLFRLLQQGEWIPAESTPEDELERIAARVKEATGLDLPMPGAPGGGRPKPKPGEEDDDDDDGGGDDE